MISNNYKIVVDELNRIVLYDNNDPNKSYETTMDSNNVISLFDAKDYNYTIFNNRGLIVMITGLDKYKYRLLGNNSNIRYEDYMGSDYFKYIKYELNTDIPYSKLFYSVKLIAESAEGLTVFDLTDNYKAELSKLDNDENYSFDSFLIQLDKSIKLQCCKLRLVIEPDPSLDSNIFYGIVPVTNYLYVYDDLKYRLLKELANIRTVDIKMNVLRNNLNTLSDIYVRYLIAEQLLDDGDYTNADVLLESINNEFNNWRSI